MASRLSRSQAAVLVVEDECLLRTLMVELFEDAGFAVADVANAADAIAVLEARADISLVVTDVQMPGAMDGLRLAAAVRDRWPPVGVIIVSGRALPRAEDLPAGAHFLPKPCSGADMLALARRCLGAA